ncbi:MAG: DUF11 domain-containing protein, partial [Thermoplasmata archaeon]|nr:DUF11 domain-containing protein [Thermoplasmata archaeon]
SDGLVDYNRGGTDYWLNTTIPGNYAPDYANKDISVYIGPVAPKKNFGYDRLFVLLDSDDDPMTGAIIMGGIGIDHTVLIEGKNNKIYTSQCFEFDSEAGNNPWVLLGNISSAIDSHRMELAIDPAALGITSDGNFTIYAAMEDWAGDQDMLDSPIDSLDITVFAPINTRSQEGDVSLAAKPKIAITKDVDLTTASPGDVLMYTITYVVSKATAYDALFTEIYPTDVTFLNATPAPTLGDNVWDFGDLANGVSGTIFINVTVDAAAANNSVLTNTIDATWNDGGTWPAGSTSTATSTTIVIIPEFSPIFGILIISGIAFISRRKFINQDRA